MTTAVASSSSASSSASSSLLLDEATLSSLPAAQKPVFALEWLRRLEAQACAERAAQGRTEHGPGGQKREELWVALASVVF